MEENNKQTESNQLNNAKNNVDVEKFDIEDLKKDSKRDTPKDNISEDDSNKKFKFMKRMTIAFLIVAIIATAGIAVIASCAGYFTYTYNKAMKDYDSMYDGYDDSDYNLDYEDIELDDDTDADGDDEA